MQINRASNRGGGGVSCGGSVGGGEFRGRRLRTRTRSRSRRKGSESWEGWIDIDDDVDDEEEEEEEEDYRVGFGATIERRSDSDEV